MERFTTYKPKFEEGVILKAVKMNQLIHQAFELPNLIFTGFSNGIISGFDIRAEDNNIIVSAGVFCFDGEIYILNKAVSILYSAVNEWRYLKICHLDTIVKSDGIEGQFSLEIGSKTPKSNEIELCRFKLQEGAKLRYKYDDFEDMNTEFDTVNLIYSPYSSKEQASLNPKILKNFAREMLDLKPENILDTFFCLQVLGFNTVMNVEEVVRYIEIKTGEKLEQISNFKLYRKLLYILQEEKSNHKIVKKKTREQRKIIVD